MTTFRKTIMAVAATLTFGTFAADVAFYPFTEGSSGDDAIGATILNSVNTETLSGTVSQAKSVTTATATFLDDVPGRYLYTNATWSADALYRSDVYQSIQTTWVTNASDQITSATTVNFADLGARLAGLDAWTVEFFFKVDEFLSYTANKYPQNVIVGDDEGIGVCIEHKKEHISIRPFAENEHSNANKVYTTVYLKNNRSILPGMWHHLALQYNSTDRKLTAVLDYNRSGTVTCVKEELFDPGFFLLGNGCSAMRFAALRVTDCVLKDSELMRASDVPPNILQSDTRFHWSFESSVLGASLGTVLNDAPWRTLWDAPVTNQYAYATDGQTFMPSLTGDGIVTPLVFTYKTKTELGTLTMDGYASNITASTRTQLAFPDGTVRANTNCAFLAVGPKDVNNETWGKGASFTMSDSSLLVSSDFTAETYWRPDIDGWSAILGDDAGNRYRSSIFGIKGKFKDDVQGKFTTEYVWSLTLDMNATNFTYRVVTGQEDSGTNVFTAVSFDRKMKETYLQKCNDGRLHHYAVVYRVADAENDSKPTVRLYIDHEEEVTCTMSAPMVDFPTFFNNVTFSVGNGLNAHPMQGWYDEIRYTARALAPSEFLRLQRQPRGLMIVVQ